MLAKPAKTPQFLSQIRFDVGRGGYLNRYVALREVSQEALCHRKVPNGGFVGVDCAEKPVGNAVRARSDWVVSSLAMSLPQFDHPGSSLEDVGSIVPALF